MLGTILLVILIALAAMMTVGPLFIVFRKRDELDLGKRTLLVWIVFFLAYLIFNELFKHVTGGLSPHLDAPVTITVYAAMLLGIVIVVVGFIKSKKALKK